MNRIITNRIKASTAFKIVLWLFIAVCIVVAIDDPVTAYGLACLGLVLLGWFYSYRIAPFNRVKKFIGEQKLRAISKDIGPYVPTYPKSKISCGKEAFYSKKHAAIVPYNHVCWVYVFVFRIWFIPVFRRTNFKLTNGKNIALKCNKDELTALLNNYIIPANPHVLLGHTDENIKAYHLRVKSYKESLKRT